MNELVWMTADKRYHPFGEHLNRSALGCETVGSGAIISHIEAPLFELQPCETCYAGLPVPGGRPFQPLNFEQVRTWVAEINNHAQQGRPDRARSRENGLMLRVVMEIAEWGARCPQAAARLAREALAVLEVEYDRSHC